MPDSTPPATAPTATQVAAARTTLNARVDALVKQDVSPRDIEPQALVSPLEAIIAIVKAHLAKFATEDIDAAVLACMHVVGGELQTQIDSLPDDQRRLARAPQSLRDLLGDAYALMGRYLARIDRKAKGPVLRDAAQRLGVGTKRGRSLSAQQATYKDVLHAAEDAELRQKFSIKADHLGPLQAMQAKLLGVLKAKPGSASTRVEERSQMDRLRLALDVFYGDVGGAAEWVLGNEERLTLVSLLPRTEVGRAKPKAPVTVPEPVVAAEEEPEKK